MNHYLIASIFILFLLHACQTAPTLDEQMLAEVLQLKTLEEKEAYLTTIFEDDQRVRETSFVQQKDANGHYTKEYLKEVQTIMTSDSINLRKVEHYLHHYGHPSKDDKLNYKAMTAIWAVVHHSPTWEAKARNFEPIYEAHLKEDLDLEWLLKRMYLYKLGTDFKLESDDKYDNEIDQLIYELDLEEKKNQVIEKLGRL